MPDYAPPVTYTWADVAAVDAALLRRVRGEAEISVTMADGRRVQWSDTPMKEIVAFRESMVREIVAFELATGIRQRRGTRQFQAIYDAGF